MVAKKKSSSTPKKDSPSRVVRITANDTAQKNDVESKAAAKKTSKEEVKKAATTRPEKTKVNPFVAIGNYFRGAWHELKQVRWPNRRETWGLTVAVLVFTAFFVGLIVLLDFTFSQLFELIIK